MLAADYLFSVDYGASGAGVHLRLLRKSPKNSRRDFAHLGPRPRWRDVAGERPPPKHMVTRIDGARLRRAGGPDQSQEWTMTGAADDHPPIAPPDTRPVPSGWVMLAEAFTSVANIVDDPEEAASRAATRATGWSSTLPTPAVSRSRHRGRHAVQNILAGYQILCGKGWSWVGHLTNTYLVDEGC